MPTIAHSLLRTVLLFQLAQYEEASRFKVLLGVRTQIVEGRRYRIPDVMLCPRPLPKGKICDVVPWAVIEILSPDDTLAGTREPFEDYAGIGVRELVLMEAEACIAYRFEAGSLIQTSFKSLTLPDFEVNFDSAELFSRLRHEREEEIDPSHNRQLNP